MNYVVAKTEGTEGNVIEISDLIKSEKDIRVSSADTVIEFSDEISKEDFEVATEYLMQQKRSTKDEFEFAGKWLTVICIVRNIPENKHKEYVRAALKTVRPITMAHGLFVNIVGNPEKLKMDEVTQIMDEFKKAFGKDTSINFGTQFEDNVKNPSVVAVIANDIPERYIKKCTE